MIEEAGGVLAAQIFTFLSNAAPVLLGGVITLFVSELHFKRAAKKESELRKEEALSVGALNAKSGYVKILDNLNLLLNIKTLIEDGHEVTKAAGISGDGVWRSVPASVGAFKRPQELSFREFSFLMTKEFMPLVEGVRLSEQKIRNHTAIWQSYCDEYIKFQEWLSCNPDIELSFDGVLSTLKIPDHLKAYNDIQEGKLNVILGHLMTELATDVPTADQALRDYIQAAHEVFGERFPKIKISEVTKC